MADLVCNDLSMTFTNPQTGAAVEALKDINFTLKKGELLSVLGPSGCGKSTLLRLIAGLEDVTSGTVRIDDNDMTDVPPAKRGLAMVFQSYALYPHMSVRKNIAFPLRSKMPVLHLPTQAASKEYLFEILLRLDFE